MAWPDRRLTTALAVAAIAGSLAACGVFSRRDGVYVEAIPTGGLEADRAAALRVTVFEYGDEAGGFVEFYAIDGVYNTLRSPWVAPTRCRYFGPVPVRDNRFRVVTEGVDGVPQLVMDLAWNGALRTELRAEVQSDAGAGIAQGVGPWPLTFELDRGHAAERRCGEDLALQAPDASALGDTAPDASADADAGSGD